MVIISALFLIVCIIVFIVFKRSPAFYQGILNLPFLLMVFVSSLIYFCFSYIIFGGMFAVGETKSMGSQTFLNSISSIASYITMPVVSIVEYADRIYYNNTGGAFPNFVYFPISFLLNSLLFGFFIALFLIRFRKKVS